MEVVFVDVNKVEQRFPVPSHLEAAVFMYAKEFGLSVEEVIISCLRIGWNTIAPKRIEYQILGALMSPDFQLLFAKKVYEDNNGGPIVGIVEGVKNGYRFSWADGRFFEGVLENPDSNNGFSYIDNDGNRLTLEEIREGTSPYIKKGKPPLQDN